AKRGAEPRASGPFEQLARSRFADHVDDDVADLQRVADARAEVDAFDEQVGAANGWIDRRAELGARAFPRFAREQRDLTLAATGVVAVETLARDRGRLVDAAYGESRTGP